MPEELTTFRKELDRLRAPADRDQLVHLMDEILDRWERDRDETARRINRLTENLQTLDSRLLTVENSRVFRALQSVTGWLRAWRARSTQYVRLDRSDAGQRRAYQLWLERERLNTPGIEWFSEQIQRFTYLPRFSVLLHVHRPRKEALAAAVESLTGQSYPRWELCVCDDASPEPWVSQYFRALADSDPRVQYLRSEQVMQGPSSLNRAGMLGSGEYAAFFGQHDRLTPHALFHFAEALQRKRPEVLYADEDLWTESGDRERPCFKPGWSPDLLLSSMYLSGLLAVSRETLNDHGWLRADRKDACLYDLTLRLAESRASFHHVPVVACSREKRDASDQARGRLTPRLKLTGTPLVSIIVCSRNAKLMRNCLKGVDNLTAYPVRETVVVQHKTGDDAAMNRLLARSHCMRVTYAGPFDFASMNNQGAQAANGEVLVFLNDDVEPLSADWLKELLVQVQRPEVGVVGAMLLYPSGTIQHAGIALGLMDGAGHPHRGTLGQGFWPWTSVTRNVSAVTGACLAIRRSVFEELGGFDPSFPVNYNDVDLCLRARQAGYEVILAASAVLRHEESKTRVQGVSWRERELFFQRWGRLVEQGDPYYSPHLTRTREDCSLVHG